MSNFETINFDPNVLFSLSYNFEGLKVLLSQFSKNQKMIIDKLNGLENKTNQNSLYINNINIGLKNQGIDLGELPKIELREEKHSRVSSDLISNLGGGDNERIKDLEKKLSKLNTFIPKFPEDKGKTLTDILDEYQYGLKGISDKNNELDNKIKNILEDLEEIKVKVADFNIYDIFKNNDNENGPNVDIVTGLIQNLDNKVMKKLSLQDERFKKNESDIYKIKNDALNANNLAEQTNKIVINLRETVDKNTNSIDENKNDSNEKLQKLQDALNNLINRHNDDIDVIRKEIKNLNELNDNLIKEDFTEKEISIINPKQEEKTTIELKEFKKFKDHILKKIQALDNRLLDYVPYSKIEEIKKDIEDMKNSLNSKPSQQDFYDINEHISHLDSSIENLKENQDIYSEEIKKIKTDLNNHSKSIEQIILTQYSMKTNLIIDPENVVTLSILNTKLENYVNRVLYDEDKKELDKEIQRIKRSFESQKQNYYELYEITKSKANEDSLKNLEDYLVGLIDELRDRSSKTYSNRIEVNKNFKKIDLQIKQIIELYNKIDHGDNWLLAKRPIGAYHCASCDAYIGDLKDNNEFNHNKIQEYEHFNQTNRVGNGFSRILNLVNIQKENKKEKSVEDGILTNNNNNENDNVFIYEKDGNDKIKNFQTTSYNVNSREKVKKILPPLNKTEELYYDNENYMNTDGPKVVKIVRLNKK